MNKDISFLYSKTVTQKDNKLIQNYINELSELERERFNSIVNNLIDLDSKITHNAVRLTLKVYKDTNIKTFPYIQKEACKGYSMNDGTYSFSMNLLDDTHYRYISSYSQVKDLLLKSNTIITDFSKVYGGDMVLDIK